MDFDFVDIFAEKVPPGLSVGHLFVHYPSTFVAIPLSEFDLGSVLIRCMVGRSEGITPCGPSPNTFQSSLYRS
jgi:hypothetical protein